VPAKASVLPVRFSVIGLLFNCLQAMERIAKCTRPRLAAAPSGEARVIRSDALWNTSHGTSDWFHGAAAALHGEQSQRKPHPNGATKPAIQPKGLQA
jgi:hypothetical protein